MKIGQMCYMRSILLYCAKHAHNVDHTLGLSVSRVSRTLLPLKLVAINNLEITGTITAFRPYATRMWKNRSRSTIE